MPATSPDSKTSASSITSNSATTTAAAPSSAVASAKAAPTTLFDRGAERLLAYYCGELKSGEEASRAARIEQFLNLITEYIEDLHDQKQLVPFHVKLAKLIASCDRQNNRGLIELETMLPVASGFAKPATQNEFNLKMVVLLFYKNRTGAAITLLVSTYYNKNDWGAIQANTTLASNSRIDIESCLNHIKRICGSDYDRHRKFCISLFSKIFAGQIYPPTHLLPSMGMDYPTENELYGPTYVTAVMASVTYDSKTEKYSDEKQLKDLFHWAFIRRELNGLRVYFTNHNKRAVEIAWGKVHKILFVNFSSDTVRLEYLEWLNKQPGTFVQAVSARFNTNLQKLRASVDPLDVMSGITDNHFTYHNAFNNYFVSLKTALLQGKVSKAEYYLSCVTMRAQPPAYNYHAFTAHRLHAYCLDQQKNKTSKDITNILEHCKHAITTLTTATGVGNATNLVAVMPKIFGKNPWARSPDITLFDMTFVLIDLFTRTADYHLQKGQHQLALANYQIVLDIVSTIEEVKTLIDAALFSRCQPEGYVDHFTISPQLFFKMGLCCLALNNTKDAVRYFIYALQGDDATAEMYEACRQRLTQFARGQQNLHYLLIGLLQPNYINFNSDIRQRLYPHSTERLALTRDFCRGLISAPPTAVITTTVVTTAAQEKESDNRQPVPQSNPPVQTYFVTSMFSNLRWRLPTIDFICRRPPRTPTATTITSTAITATATAITTPATITATTATAAEPTVATTTIVSPEKEEDNRKLALRIEPHLDEHEIPTILFRLSMLNEGATYYLALYMLVPYPTDDEKHAYQERVFGIEESALTPIICTAAGEQMKQLVPTILEYASFSFFNNHDWQTRNAHHKIISEYAQRLLDTCNTQLKSEKPDYRMIMRYTNRIIGRVDTALDQRISAYLIQIKVNYFTLENYEQVCSDCDTVIVLLKTKYTASDTNKLVELLQKQLSATKALARYTDPNLLFELFKFRGHANFKLERYAKALEDFTAADTLFAKEESPHPDNSEVTSMIELCKKQIAATSNAAEQTTTATTVATLSK